LITDELEVFSGFPFASLENFVNLWAEVLLLVLLLFLRLEDGINRLDLCLAASMEDSFQKEVHLHFRLLDLRALMLNVLQVFLANVFLEVLVEKVERQKSFVVYGERLVFA